MRRFYFYSADGMHCMRSETFNDDTLVMTNVGKKQAQELQGSSKASLLVPGKTGATGNVVYTSYHGGAGSNRIFVEHEIGLVGPSYPSRPLAISFDPTDEDGLRIVVTYGTTGSGTTLTPTAQEVANAVNTAPALQQIVSAVSGGNGDAGVIDPTYLTGGLDDGDWRKFNVYGGHCLRITTVEVI